MRKQLITLLCVAGVLLWGVTAVNAGTLNWTLLTDSTIKGGAPVSQSGYWVVPPGSTGSQKCNFDTIENCATAGNPAEGSFSFTAIEYYKSRNPDDTSTWYSCLDLSEGAPGGGAPCACANPPGTPCDADGDCQPTSGGCGTTPADCCPGAIPEASTCKQCTEIAGPDSYSFFGSAAWAPAPNMDTCQRYGTVDQFQTLRYDVATSESVPGSGGACIKLDTPGGSPYIGVPAGVGPITSGSLDVDVFVKILGLPCTLVGTTIQNINYTGRVYAVTEAAPVGVCGYSGGAVPGQVKQLLNLAQAKGGNYLMILCGDTNVPASSKTACLRNAHVDFSVVAWTDDDASSEPNNGCPTNP